MKATALVGSSFSYLIEFLPVKILACMLLYSEPSTLRSLFLVGATPETPEAPINLVFIRKQENKTRLHMRFGVLCSRVTVLHTAAYS